MCFSSNLLTNESNEIGRYYGISVLLVVFGIGRIEDTFHAVGILPNLMDILNRWANEESMDSAVSFNVSSEMPSRPDALVVSTVHNK